MDVLSSGELEKVMKKHPDRIPIYVRRDPNSQADLPDIRRHKFLVPSHFTMGHVLHIIRTWISVPPHQALFMFVGNTHPSIHSPLIEVYQACKSPDQLLYVTYTTENTFGGTHSRYSPSGVAACPP